MSRADLAALEQLDRLVELRRRQEQLAAQVPPEISTEQIQYNDGVVRFSHVELGNIGQLKMIPVPAYMAPTGGCLIHVELFSDDQEEDPNWDEKYCLPSLMVKVCTSALLDEKVMQSKMSDLPEAREQRRLSLRCLARRHSEELRAFVEQLSEQDYPRLIAGIEQARATAPGQDCPATERYVSPLGRAA